MPRPLPPPPERRAFGRRETFIHAIVRIAGRPPEACIVRNVSDHGALLELPSGLELPDQFRLVIDARNIDVVCQPRRRNGNQIGVEFSGNAIDGDAISAHAPKEATPSADRPAIARSAPHGEPSPPSMPSRVGVNPILAAGPIVTVATGDAIRRQFGLLSA